MLQQRVAANPGRILFRDAHEANQESTYAQVAWYTRTLAGVFLQCLPKEPRVAILCDNCIDSACADLACLLYGMLVSPLNVHFDAETLAWIFQRLAIDVVVTDSDERIARLSEVRAILGRDFKLFRTGDRVANTIVRGLEVTPLRHAAARVDLTAVSAQLASRPSDLFAPATVMFTSGSTGRPKGVVFSQYNLVTKRFARAAALPSVGRSEVLLCYLPLFHTFGRFFGAPMPMKRNRRQTSVIASICEVRYRAITVQKDFEARERKLRRSWLMSSGVESGEHRDV